MRAFTLASAERSIAKATDPHGSIIGSYLGWYLGAQVGMTTAFMLSFADWARGIYFAASSRRGWSSSGTLRREHKVRWWPDEAAPATASWSP